MLQFACKSIDVLFSCDGESYDMEKMVSRTHH